MVASTRIIQDMAEVRLLKPRLAVTDIDRLHRDVTALLRRRDVATVRIDMKRVDMVDNSLVAALRSMALEARRRRRHMRLDSVPSALHPPAVR